jgi:hypothetical protein
MKQWGVSVKSTHWAALVKHRRYTVGYFVPSSSFLYLATAREVEESEAGTSSDDSGETRVGDFYT